MKLDGTSQMRGKLQINNYPITALRESDPEFHEFAVKTEISDFFISGQEKPFGDLFPKITIKLSKEFLFREIRQNVKCRIYYVAVIKFCRDLVYFKALAEEDRSMY